MKKSDQTKSQIIAASAQLFNQKGYTATSMKDIQTATGLTKGGLYGHFDSKDDLAEAAFEYAALQNAGAIRARTLTIEHPVDKLLASLDFYRAEFFSMPILGGCPIQNTAVEADDNNFPKLMACVRKHTDMWVHSIERLLEKGQNNGQIHAQVKGRAFAIAFIGQLEGAILMTRIYENIEMMDIVLANLRTQIEGLRNTIA